MSRIILALEKDLFFAVRIHDTLRHHDIEATTVRSLEAFTQKLDDEKRPELVIVDIATRGVDWEAAIRAAHTRGYPVLAFGSHMDLEARKKALDAGAAKVVANSKFSSDMLGLVTRMMTGQSAVAEAVEVEENE